MSLSLREMAEKFGHSEPIFKAISIHGDGIKFEVVNPYDPKTVDLDIEDPIVKLMISNYYESFSRHKKCFERSELVEPTLRDVYAIVKTAFRNNSPLKKPQQSKLDEWLEIDKFRSPLLADGFLMLYRYIVKHANHRHVLDASHSKNFLAILDKMRTTYDRHCRQP